MVGNDYGMRHPLIETFRVEALKQSVGLEVAHGNLDLIDEDFPDAGMGVG